MLKTESVWKAPILAKQHFLILSFRLHFNPGSISTGKDGLSSGIVVQVRVVARCQRTFFQVVKKPDIYYSANTETIVHVESEVGAMHLFANSLNHMIPENATKRKRYSIVITIHGYAAIDKTLIHGGAVNYSNRETIIITDTG